jgi:hypothetical protein
MPNDAPPPRCPPSAPTPLDCPAIAPLPWTHEGRGVRDALGYFVLKVFISGATEDEMIRAAAFVVASANAAAQAQERETP